MVVLGREALSYEQGTPFAKSLFGRALTLLHSLRPSGPTSAKADLSVPRRAYPWREAGPPNHHDDAGGEGQAGEWEDRVPLLLEELREIGTGVPRKRASGGVNRVTSRKPGY